jgi:ABC-type lipoprotein export system ATPase subunit
MDVNSHIQLLLNKYELNYLYTKFRYLSILTTLTREGFYWALLYFSTLVEQSPELMNKLAIILLIMLIIYVPIERIFNNNKLKLIEELKLANNKYFYDKIINISKTNLLDFDLIEYNNILLFYNEHIEHYINGLKIKYDIPFRFISLVVISILNDNYLLIGLFGVYVGIITSLNEWKYIKENDLVENQLVIENKIRNYIINSKSYLINNEINKKYLIENISQYKNVNQEISTINNDLDTNINICILIYILIIMIYKLDTLKPSRFLYYFLLAHDIEFISDKITDYYKSKRIINKMQIRLNYLNNISVDYNNYKNLTTIPYIKIHQISNNNPKLYGENIMINETDHILISGVSGSGKTTLLYVFKGIVKVDNISITPNINIINKSSYITLSNHKNLFDEYLYNIITNFDEKPNVILINKALSLAKLNHKFTNNCFLNIEKLSSGERIRLLIARIIYIVKTKKYKILLFDEIDENLNDDLAIEICNNIRDIFKNNIILYISHNELVKQKFNKKITIQDSIIKYQ